MKKFKTIFMLVLAMILLITSSINVFSNTGGSVTNGVINLTVLIMEDEGYTQEPEVIVETVKQSFIEASNYLYTATNGQNRFGKIRIYLPAASPDGWPEIEEAIPPDSFNPQHSDVYINSGTGGSAHVDGFMGSRNKHIFLGIDSAFIFGTNSFAKTIVHEFGHYGYGLSDEYCNYVTRGILNRKSYQVFGRMEEDESITWFTCEEGAEMEIRDANGNVAIEILRGEGYSSEFNSNGAEASIMWVQHEDSIIHFCDSSNHNSSIPNMQNNKNKNQSAWEVMANNSKFNLVAPGGNINTIEKKDPEFIVMQKSNWNDIQLVIDRSGSMLGARMALANGGASMFIDCVELPEEDEIGDRVGIVSFAGDVTQNQSLTEVKSIADKSNMKSIINGINASGSTNIGGGLNAGLNDLISNNYRKGSGAIILLSDGEHNTGTHPNSVIPALQREGIPVFTIGVGSGTDIALMQSIAQQTGGEFYYASKPSNINIIYKTIKNRLNMFDRLTKYINDLLDSAEMSSEIVYVDSSMKQVKFTISTEDAANVSFTLKSPDGKIYSPDNTHDATYVMEDTYQIYFVDNPVPGAWEYEIENNSQRQLEISFDLSGNTSLMLQGSTDTNIYEYPTPMKVIALLHKNGIPIVDANVYATITMPDNTQVELELNDYGIMGDEMPGDGLYTGVFTDFKADGEYEITIHANNDDMQAVLGESFPGLSPDGTISASNQVPIDEKFSRTEILPTVSVSGTSKEISIVQLSTDILEMDEQNNIATVNVTRTGNINGEMSVDYKTSDLTAVEDIDYIPVNGTLHFESGEASKSFEVELLQVPSRNEYYIKEFNVTLNNPINSVLGVPESARVDIYRTEYSNNANLRSLEVDSGTLDKEFSPDVTNYSISVPYETSTVSVKASVSDRWSSMTINGNRVLSGQPSADINLETGVNKIPIVVTAEDEVTQKTYTLTVNRAASSSTNTRPRPNRPAPTPTPESTPTPEPTSTPEPIEKPDDVVPGIILSDAEGHWAEAFIKDLMEKEIVNSYPDGTVRPDEQITRAEAVMLLVKSLNLKAKNPDNIDFIDGSDIPLWVKEAVSAAQENNIIEGFEDKSFRANEKLTRNQACTIVMKAFKHGTSDGETIFDDNDHIASWAKGFVKRANELGIVKGYENNVFMPEKQVTRAEFMTMISKLLHLREEE